jgi:glycosyltransferase involved in cell wall biosynthesis
MREDRLAIFGPLPPPMTGMEAFTQTLLATLREAPNGPTGDWIHVDTSISRSISDRGKLRGAKVVRLIPQIVRSVRLARHGFGAYYPISQNRIGLSRDVALLAPFRLFRRPIVIHLHGGMLDRVLARQPRQATSLLRWLLSEPDSCGIVLTRSLRHCLEPLLPVDRIRIVPNTAVVPAWVREKDADATLRVLFVGTLTASKGYRELATAVAAVAREGVSVELDVAGEPHEPEDAAWIERAPRDSVRFLGRVDGVDKWRALQRAHVLALPTRYPPEGQPIAIIEGMAARCAIVATRREGIVDTVGDDEALLLEPAAGNALEESLAAALRALAGDRARVGRMADAARARYERELAPERFLATWLAAVVRH